MAKSKIVIFHTVTCCGTGTGVGIGVGTGTGTLHGA